jgi:hypothetical protein
MANVVQRMIQLHPAPLVDSAGDRVSKFLKHIFLCKEFKCQRQLILITRSFTHQHPKFFDSGRLFRRPFLQLSDLCAQNGFYQRAKRFQLEMAKIMRGEQPKARLLPLPAVKDDEMTSKGTEGVVVKFLVLSGLVSYNSGRYKLVANLGKQMLVMYGDGLSCKQFRNCKEQLIEQQGTFCEHYENVTVLLTVLQKVYYMLPGCRPSWRALPHLRPSA